MGHGACIGHQHINAAKLFTRRRDPALERRAVEYIDTGPRGLDAQGLQSRNRFGHLLRITGAKGDIGAFPRQGLGNGPANAARAAQYNRVLCLKLKIHVRLPFVWSLA